MLYTRFLRVSLMFEIFRNAKLSNAIRKKAKKVTFPTQNLISNIVKNAESLWMIYFVVAQRSSYLCPQFWKLCHSRLIENAGQLIVAKFKTWRRPPCLRKQLQINPREQRKISRVLFRHFHLRMRKIGREKGIYDAQSRDVTRNYFRIILQRYWLS